MLGQLRVGKPFFESFRGESGRVWEGFRMGMGGGDEQRQGLMGNP